MKARKVIAVLSLSGLIGLGAGCGQKNETTPPPAQSPAPKAASEVQKQAEAQKPAAEAAATDMQKSVTDAAAPANTQAQGLIDKTKTLIANKDYKGAGELIQELSKLKLTPEQQKLYDNLKLQLQKALASSATADAAKAAGGMLGGSK